MPKELTPAQFIERAQSEPAPLLVDVREEWELAIARLEQAVHIPMNEIPDRMQELDSSREIVVMCRSGMRSGQVARYLEHHGFECVWNLAGGIIAWSEDIDPSLTPY